MVRKILFRIITIGANTVPVRERLDSTLNIVVALMVRKWAMRMKTEHEIWGNGSGTCRLYWTEVQSPLWVQLLFLIADYKTFLILSFPRHYADIIQSSLFSPQAILFWASLGNDQEVRRQHSCLMPIWCSKVHSFMIQSYSLLSLALGFVTRRLFLRKTWKIIINTVS